jgi:predicted DsbA family dithiol-disulfide isomerase
MFAGRNFDIDAAQADIAQIAETEGLPYGMRTHSYNSRFAQELAKWAETQSGGMAIHDALFRAYFLNGVNLAQVDRLVEIAESIGLSGSAAREAVETRAFKDAVDSDWERSAAARVTGIPTYVMNGRGVTGAQPYEVLAQFVEESGAQRW